MSATKKDLLLALLADGFAFLQVDGRRDGVELPAHLLKNTLVVLQLGLDVLIPIPDLVIDENGVAATLSFQRTPFHCVIPWSAIFGISDGEHRGTLFPEDIPPDFLREPGGAPVLGIPEQPPDPGDLPPAAPTRPSKPRPSHLKLVK